MSGGERRSPGLQTKFLGGGGAGRWWEVGAKQVMSLGPPTPLPAFCSHRPKFGIWHLPNVLNFFFLFPFRFVLFFRGTANDRAEGRLAQPIPEPLQHRFPTHCGAGTERRGRPAPAPPLPRGPLALLGEKGSWTEAAGARVRGCWRPSLLPGVGRGTRSQASLPLCPLGWKEQVETGLGRPAPGLALASAARELCLQPLGFDSALGPSLALDS